MIAGILLLFRAVTHAAPSFPSTLTSYTVYFWIEEFTVKEAKLLLRSTGASVIEIADMLNFPNSSFFAKFFRRHTGFSPVEFRKNE